VANHTVPCPSLKIDQIEPSRSADGVNCWQDHQSFPAIDADTDSSWRLVQTILTGVILLSGPDIYHSGHHFDRPDRIEFVMGEDTFTTRGLILFDGRGRLIVHVVNALLGYGGSGPMLSKQILELLGVPGDIFELIQLEADQSKGVQPYKFIVTREGLPRGAWCRIRVL